MSLQHPVKSNTSAAFGIGLPAMSFTTTVNCPDGSATTPLLPMSEIAHGTVDVVGLGTNAIAVPAMSSPHTERSVALRTKPVIGAPPLMDHPVANAKARLSCEQSGLAASHLLSSFSLYLKSGEAKIGS